MNKIADNASNDRKTIEVKNAFKMFNQRQFSKELPMAIKKNDIAYAGKLLEDGADPNMRLPGAANSCLHLACIARNYEIAELLLAYGTNPNIMNTYGDTPLMYSCIYDDIRTASLLIQYGAEIDKGNFMGKTPLMFAAENSSYNVAKLLIEKKAYIDAKMVGGKNALMFAIEKKDYDICKLIIDNLGSVEDPGLLMLAITNYEEETANLLIEKGVNFHYKCFGKYPLIEAVRYRLGSIVELLIKKGVDVNSVDDERNTALSLAPEKYKELLKKAGAKNRFALFIDRIITKLSIDRIIAKLTRKNMGQRHEKTMKNNNNNEKQ